jgi:hypothetical protein
LCGWPGKTYPINYRKLIFNSIKELEDGLYPEDRLSREIDIIKNIAIQNDEYDYFKEIINNSNRNKRRPLEGNAISPRLVYLDAKDFKVYNVFEASYFIQNLRNVYSFISFKLFINMIFNSINYRILSFKKSTRMSNYV